MSQIVTILLVDDNEVSRLTCCRFLERNGYLVVEAEDGRRARRTWPLHRHLSGPMSQ